MAFTVKAAELSWQEDIPYSARFNDIYFSKESGIAESYHNFIQHNQLEQRFCDLNSSQHFTIAETGFGSGLNFMLACKLWLEKTQAPKTLTFISAEKHPLTHRDLEKAHRLWPQLKPYSRALQAAYPPLIQGLHYRELFKGRIRLLLGFDEVKEVLKQVSFNPVGYSQYTLKLSPRQAVDAWFLDGFAPDKNPDMWQSEIFQRMAELSRPGSSFATFSCAGLVRRGLQQAGFKVIKGKGFGRKREMCFGTFFGLPDSQPPPQKNRHKPNQNGTFWTLNPDLLEHSQTHHKNGCISIIGAGLAGAITAYQLARQGFTVKVIEKHSKPAQEASGNPQGVIYNKLAIKPGKMSEFNLQSYLFALDFYRQLFDQGCLKTGKDGNLNGVLQLAYDQQQQTLYKKLYKEFQHSPELVEFLTAEQASVIAGTRIKVPALWFKHSGWINPANLTTKLLQHPNITLLHDTIKQLQVQSDDSWKLIGEKASYCSQSIVICNSHQINQIQNIIHLPVQKIRGQITQIKKPANMQNQLKTSICHQGYICPENEQGFCFGASFKLKDDSLELRLEEQNENSHKLYKHLPELAHELRLKHQALSGRVAYRCASYDYLPFVGPIARTDDLQSGYSLLQQNAKLDIPYLSQYWRGLYFNIAHGSKGLSSIPLSAAIISALIQQQPLPISAQLYPYLHPNRVTIKNIIRNKTS